MKSLIRAALMLCVVCGLAFAQGKPKIAVYVTGGKTANENTAIGTKIVAELLNDGKYAAIERTAAFLNEIAKEQIKQRSGAIDEKQIRELGIQAGVQFVCVVDITAAFGSNLLSARIINVETAEVVAMGKADNPLKTLGDITTASQQVMKSALTKPSTKDAKTLAVYVTGVKNQNESKAFGTEILAALVQGGMYRAVERSNAFLAEVDKEQKAQRSGAIDDKQIAELGKNFGVQFICIANIMNVLGSTQVSARIVDVESAEIVALGETESKLGSLDELANASTRIFQAMAKQLGIKIVTLQYRGQTYKTVDIGGKIWMAENLNYRTGNSWCYNNDESNCRKYGRLYDWNTAMQVCREGWRLPNDQDWNDLVQIVGDHAAGKNLKSKTGWKNSVDGSSGNGTDKFEFSALPGGYRFIDGHFGLAGEYGYWWSAMEINVNNADMRIMFPEYDGVFQDEKGGHKTIGYSVRCLRD